MPLFLEKPLGLSPLDLIQSLPDQSHKYSFAGRLDPMARGKMIVLVDDECKNQELYCGLDKIYEFSILYGFQTDTYDILGLWNDSCSNIDIDIDTYQTKIYNLNLNQYLGKSQQLYPSYSSIKVNKKPLWWWSREKRIHEITIPSKIINIYQLESIKPLEILSQNKLLEEALSKILSLPTHRHLAFRVPQIIKQWKSVPDTNKNLKYLVGHYKAKVSSGTYIRSLVNKIGLDIGCGAIAWDIHRIDFLDKKNIR